MPGLFAPITINERRYMDGGMRSGTNADLAVGHDQVLVVSLMAGPRAETNIDPRLARLFQTMDGELKVLADAGATVKIVGPDEGSTRAMGVNLMDGSIAPLAAEQGVRQGEEMAERVGRFWG